MTAEHAAEHTTERTAADGGDAGDPRARVRAWLRANWDTSLTLAAWWRRLADAGYAYPSWPAGLGGLGLSPDDARDVLAELAAARVIGAPAGIGQGLGAGTLLAHGTPEQWARLLPGLATGQEAWVQLFSEPGSGSDLASLSTRAVLDGDEWVVNGQKVWSSGALSADRGMLLARTNVDVPKHDGITFLIIDLDQPGVEVRPLRQMSGDAHFCEVFLTDARVPADRVVGAVDDGWRVARTTLLLERSGLGGEGLAGLRLVEGGRRSGNLDRVVADVLAAPAPNQRAGFFLPPEAMIALARERGRGADPVIRQALADYYVEAEVIRLNAQRVRAAAQAGRLPGAAGSTLKLAISLHGRRYRDLMLSLVGPDATLVDADGPDDGRLHATYYWSFAGAIGGGTDEIQRNVISEQVLGLPKDADAGRNVPYRELRVGTQRR
ncbi:acyl-CoA dehydrogenase family protein [Frankia sp. AvcI1]|uniref:acyl-CoA dehydrogenase family protein n=1 Tax=Frankia sp. AvcI1 TaxID=573496 RepID=UPI0006EBF005|nr:acyl-CoA dehydrogenase family protein [Frankia sp. AvcI1]